MEAEQLSAELSQFIGTTQYARLYPKILLTDGAVFLAEKAGAWWLMDVYASHLITGIDRDKEPFTCLNLTKTGDAALVIIDDGNGVGLASQEIPFTDFPLDAIKLYACWSEEYWVIMLPSEY